MKRVFSIITTCCLVLFAVLSMAADKAVIIPLNSNAKKVPIAYGTISSDGTIKSGSGNFTCSWANNIRYEIAIDGENYSSLNYTTVVTPWGGPVMTGTGDGSNELYIYFFNTAGVTVDRGFSFVTYK